MMVYVKIYNYIKLFIKLNDIKNGENNIYVKDLLKEIESILKPVLNLYFYIIFLKFLIY